MGTLNRDEIIRRIATDDLIRNARKQGDGTVELEPASYDLMPGVVVWKDPSQKETKGEVRKEVYKPGLSRKDQPSITIQPGEMGFVLTYQEIQMPKDLSRTVLSRDKPARQRIPSV